jgi:hypothetical protein
VYLGAPYAFFNKVLLTYQKKKESGCGVMPMKERLGGNLLWMQSTILLGLVGAP